MSDLTKEELNTLKEILDGLELESFIKEDDSGVRVDMNWYDNYNIYLDVKYINSPESDEILELPRFIICDIIEGKQTVDDAVQFTFGHN